MANASLYCPPFPPQYEPTNVDGHKTTNSTKLFEWMDSGFQFHSSPPSINYGAGHSWPSYGTLRNRDYSKIGTGWYNSNHENGAVKANWRSTDPERSYVSIGGNSGLWLPVGTDYENTGLGFEVIRERTDSSNNNLNAEAHCCFIYRWGVEFARRESGLTKFWSSPDIMGNGSFSTNQYSTGSGSASGRIWRYYYHKLMFKDVGLDMSYDWVVKRVWFCICTRQTSKGQSGTCELSIYNMKSYHDMHASQNSGNRWVKPKMRPFSERDKPQLGFNG